MKRNIKLIIFPVVLIVFTISGWAQTDSVLISDEGISNEKVHIPYGEQNKKNVTSSISTISGDRLTKGAVSNFGNTLFGKLPGLSVYQGSGEPGKNSPTLRIRGASRPPLVIIDGFERDMTYIAPEEIESVSVLKDAAALALYGMKGANGAILITTKRGKKQKGEINVSIQSGVQTLAKTMEVLGASEYMTYYNQAAVNDGLPEKYTASDIAAAGTSPRYPDVDWKDLVLRKATNISKANIGFLGGSEFVNYFVNVGTLYNNGIYKPKNPDMDANNNLLRMNIRSNIDMNVSDNTVFSMNLAGSINRGVYPADPTDRIWTSLSLLPPNAMNAVNPDGSYGGTSIYLNNPLGMLEKGGRNTDVSSFLNADFKISQKLGFITEGLAASIGYVIDNGAYNSDGNWRYFTVKEIAPGTGENYDYYSYRETTQYNQWSNANSSRYTSFNADITYDMPETNGHKLDVLLRYQSDRQYLSRGDLSPYLTNNYGVRIQYANNEKYLLELVASYFGSDQYAEDNKYGFFPSASVGWVFSNESFISASNILSYGKLKASYGVTGFNRYINGRYPYVQFYQGGGGFPFGTDWTWFGGIEPDMLANPDIKWEVSTKFNLGLELELFGKLTFEGDYFYNVRTDVLYIDYQHPSVTGAALPYENIGKLTDRGFDLVVGYTQQETDFKWYTDLVFSYYDNKINEMGEAPYSGNLAHLNRTGTSLGSIFGYETVGYFSSESDITTSPTQTFGTPRVGDLKYKDLNNDNIIDSRDMKVIGNSLANIEFGVRFGCNWKNFDAEVFIQSQLNRDISLAGNSLAGPFLGGNAVTEIVKESDFPTLTLSNMNNYQSSEFWVRSGDFVKLRNVEIGYTLPGNTLSKLKMEKVRFFAKAVNVLTVSKWKYTDPEFTGVGYPPVKSYLLGVNVNF